MALANTFWIDVYRAQLDDYARKMSEFAQAAERAGITADHPLVKQLAETWPKVDIPSVAIPEAPKIDLARITRPLNPKP